MNLLEQQAANRRRTWLVMRLFIAVPARRSASASTPSSSARRRDRADRDADGALLVGCGSSCGVMRLGDRMVLASASAQPLDEAIAAATTDDEKLRYPAVRQHRRGDGDRRGSAEAGGLRHSRTPIRTRLRRAAIPQHASLAVTQGLLETPQPRGTAGRRRARDGAHPELRHPADDDRCRARRRAWRCSRTGRAAACASARISGGRSAVEPGLATAGGSGARWSVCSCCGSSRSSLAPIVGAAARDGGVSRTREYQADATGAELTRNPARARERAREDRRRRRARPRRSSAAPRICASPIRVGKTQASDGEGLGNRPVGDASADGEAHRDAQADGVSADLSAAPASSSRSCGLHSFAR